MGACVVGARGRAPGMGETSPGGGPPAGAAGVDGRARRRGVAGGVAYGAVTGAARG